MGKELQLVLGKKKQSIKLKITKPSLKHIYFEQNDLFGKLNLRPKHKSLKNGVKCELGYVVITLVKDTSKVLWPSLVKSQGQGPTEGEWSENYPYLLEEFLEEDDEELRAEFEKQFLLEMSRGH